jgi:hypothetical protein
MLSAQLCTLHCYTTMLLHYSSGASCQTKGEGEGEGDILPNQKLGGSKNNFQNFQLGTANISVISMICWISRRGPYVVKYSHNVSGDCLIISMGENLSSQPEKWSFPRTIRSRLLFCNSLRKNKNRHSIMAYQAGWTWDENISANLKLL